MGIWICVGMLFVGCGFRSEYEWGLFYDTQFELRKGSNSSIDNMVLGLMSDVK